jgi:hypothetical protein
LWTKSPTLTRKDDNVEDFSISGNTPGLPEENSPENAAYENIIRRVRI